MTKHFSSLKDNATLKDLAYKAIKSQIISASIKPGERLNEEEISKAMNTSRGPIREALIQLEKEGFVEIIPRKGAKVTNISIQEVKDIFEARELIELYAIDKSFDSIDHSRIKYFEDAFMKYSKGLIAEESILDYLPIGRDFHSAITEHCGNTKLLEILNKLREQIKWYMSYAVQGNTLEISEHLKIIEAIKKKDKNLVIMHLRNHLERVKKSIIENLHEGD
jgi:DNA-binding GntR family transcriptional regulator